MEKRGNLKVLLVAPLDPVQPMQLKSLMGGENTYTRMLLQYPPPGITFIHFSQALREKIITYYPLYYLLLWLQKIRMLPPGPRPYVLSIHTDLDLIYCHAHPIKLVNTSVPLVISDSSSNFVFLKYYLKLPQWLLLIWQWSKQIIFQFAGIIDGEINVDKSRVLFVFSKWARKIKNSKFKIHNTHIIYPGLHIPEVETTSRSNSRKFIKVLFVGVWFERKGGKVVLQTFRLLMRTHPFIRLTIFGQLPRDVKIENDEPIVQKNYVSYAELLHAYRTHDILVHVPPEVEGYGMTVPEAMSYGVVPVVSDVCALPEFVTHNRSGLVVRAGSVQALEHALTRLIADPGFRHRLSKGARNEFLKKFSLPVFHGKLLSIFDRAIRNQITLMH